MRVACMLMVFACVGASPARAQQDRAEAEAEKLFLQGRELLKQGHVAEACARFEASHELDPAPGTLLNLALCREEQGKVASAWALYRETALQAALEGQARHEAVARARAQALEAELPRLIIEVAETSQVSGLVIEREGVAVDAALLGKVVYVDPGAHRVVARAPGYKEWIAEIRIEKGKQATVTIPVLQPEEKELSGRDVVKDVQAPGPDGKVAAGPDDVGASGQDAVKDVLDPRPDVKAAAGPEDVGSGIKRPGRTRRLVGLGAGSAGVAAVAAGLGFGWSARATWNDAFSSGLCDRDTLKCWSTGQDQVDSARSRALASNLLMGAGVALAVTGVVLYVTAPGRTEKAGVAVVPVAGPSELGVAVQGGF
jgi:hypothetical protein